MKKILIKILAALVIFSFVPQYEAFAVETQISVSSYTNIELSEPLPKTFYKNEVYTIKGKITSGTYDAITAILQKSGSRKTTTFKGNVKNNSFSVSVFFPESGSFYIGLLPGEEGDSKALETKVETSLPLANSALSPPKINSFDVKYKNDQTVIETDTTFPSIKKITFVQGTKKVIYISRQNTNLIPINYTDFSSFRTGRTSSYLETARLAEGSDFKITSGFATSAIKNFTATQHTFSETTKDITADPPDTLATITTISFSGKVNTDTDIQAYVIKPNGFIDAVNLDTKSAKGTFGDKEIIKKGGAFTFSYRPQTRGRYILEINNKEGLPILNHPLYIGTSVPLIPDFFDLNERKLFTGTLDLQKAREELLGYINSSRKEQGLNPVSMDSTINDFAQEHSRDMTNNNYFSHNNKQNQSPEDRRIAAGLKTPVSENIAKDTSIIFSHNGLMRSASHRDNILGKDWVKVGLGIAKKDGYIYITEEFSPQEITAADTIKYKTELFTNINTLRETKLLPKLTSSPSLELASKYLNTRIANENLTLDNTILSAALDKYNIDGTTLAIGKIYNSWSPILSAIITSETRILDKSWKTIGIDIQTDSSENIILLIILNK